MKRGLRFRFGIAFALVLSFVISFYITISSWDGRVYVSRGGHSRGLASIKEGLMQNLSFQVAFVENLVEGTLIDKFDEGVRIHLGNFLTQGLEEGEKGLVCEVYDRVKMVFRAGGMMVSGEPCLMVVESDCLLGEDAQRIEEIFIPLSEITRGHPMNLEWKVEGEGVSTLVMMKNMGDSWPREWFLFSIHFFDSRNLEKRLDFSREKLRDLTKKSIEFIWPDKG